MSPNAVARTLQHSMFPHRSGSHPILLTVRLAATSTRSGSHPVAAPTYFLMNLLKNLRKTFHAASPPTFSFKPVSTSFKISPTSTSSPSIEFLLLCLTTIMSHLCKNRHRKKVLQNIIISVWSAMLSQLHLEGRIKNISNRKLGDQKFALRSKSSIWEFYVHKRSKLTFMKE